MTINTDLNVQPYFDDFDESKNFHRLIFKPGVGVQARELTQLQTILQNQISRFGSNILIEGSIVKGGNFTDIRNLPYVKISDNNTSNQSVIISNYIDTKVVGSQTGVEAIVVTALPGLETQSPDLNTLYIKYTRSGQDALGADTKTFLSGETLQFYVGTTLQPDLTVTVASLSIDSSPIGIGYAVKCDEGIIYQKGAFIRFEPQLTIITKYSNQPHELVAGFVTSEDIISALTDTSLLDNASGFNNFNAPGADRLKLTPVLTVMSKTEGQADENFFAVQEYRDGRLIKKKIETQFNSINTALSKRTAEESGNYTIGSSNITIEKNKRNATAISALISPGVSYVEGERIEIVSPMSVDIPKATEFNTVEQQNISINYGQYLIVDNLLGSFGISSGDQLKLSSDVQSASSIIGFIPSPTEVIGSATIRSVVRRDAASFYVYLFNIKMNSGKSFSDVKSILAADDDALCNLILESGKASLKDSSFKSMIFPVGKSAIKTIIPTETDYVYRTEAALTVASTGTFVISLGGTETFPYGASVTLNSMQLSDILVNYSANGAIASVTSASTDSSATVLTATLFSPVAASIDVAYNVKRSNVSPIGKELQTVYMRINPTANTSGPYNLGWPDVYQIEGIYKGTTTTFTEATPGVLNVTNQFTLYTNQKEEFYDISYIVKKGSFTISASDRFLVKAKVFKDNISGSYSQSFFSVDSYPIDDTTEILPNNKIRTENIPSFKSQNGNQIRLRDSIDFRPYAANTAVYASTPAAATIWTNSVKLDFVSFGTELLKTPAPNSVVETSYEYYLARQDRLVINEKGDFVNIVGVASENPTVPNEPQKSMTLAKIIIPPFPSLSSADANKANRSEYGISVSVEDNKRYTMRDIGKIEKRIDKLEYYTTLNALEKSADDLVVLDSNGLTRFKNGILVDNFDNLLIGDVTSDDFAASVDKSFKELSPSFDNYFIDMAVGSMTNTVKSGDTISLPFTQKKIIDQPYASSYRNCVTDFYNYSGIAKIYPEYDAGYTETTAPNINYNIDLVTPFVEYTDKLNKFVPIQSVSSSSGTSTSTSVSGRTTTTSTTTNTRTQIDALEVGAGNTTAKKIGDFVTDVSFSPFLRPGVVNIFVSGLRPNTRFYFFFDEKDVNDHVTTGSVTDQINTMNPTNRFANTVIRSNERGELYAVFKIPAKTFFVGDRELLIMDVPDFNSTSAMTSSASVIYRGFNYSVEKTGFEISTRAPNFSTSTSVINTSRTTTSITTIPPQSTTGGSEWNERKRNGEVTDPIAQTFYISPDQSTDNVVMLTKLNVYFQEKDPNLGITIQIRDVENGYPSQKILAFASVRLNSASVNVSENGSLATTINFATPITLATGKDYCFVAIPDANSPNYRIWLGKTGTVDKSTGLSITSDNNSGVLFTSTNNKTWTPFQDENLKFDLWVAAYTEKTGSINMYPDDYEFIDVGAGAGIFQRGERVFVENTPLTGTISGQQGTFNILGTSTEFTSIFNVGDYIGWKLTGNDYEVSKITGISNNTTIAIADQIKTTFASNPVFFKTIVGIFDYQNENKNRIHLKKSTATATNAFSTGDILRGDISGAVAEIVNVVDVPISYTQHNIYRTNFTKTQTVGYYTSLYNDTNVNYVNTPILAQFNNNNYFINSSTIIKSRSNELTQISGIRSFVLRIDMQNSSSGSVTDSSPIIDYAISNINVYEYIINNDITGESANTGSALSRYFTKIVDLADGFDAEDVRVFLTAYRPTGSNVDVYVKFKSETDPDHIDDIPWSKLVKKDSSNVTSSVVNRFDFREFEYYLPTSASAISSEGAILKTDGTFEYISQSGAKYNNFKHFAVKIVLTSIGPHRIPRVKDMRALAVS